MRSRTILIIASALLAETAHWSALAQPALIATGSDPSADGFLAIRSDAYASWSWFASPDPDAPADLFNPPGPAELGNPTFSTFFYMFVDRTQREILNNEAQTGPPHLDASLSSEVLVGPTPSDTNGDGIDDTLDSIFRVRSPDGGTQLLIALRQEVQALPSGVSFVQIDVHVTNEGARKIRFSLLRTWDSDLPWSATGGSAYYTNDEVGTTTNGADLGRFVFVREPDDPAAAVTLSGPRGSFYYGGKHGVQPEGGPPTYDFGTDIDWWLAYGVPHTWRNHVAGIGYDADGASGSSPPGSIDPEDAFCGLEKTLSLKSGASSSVTFVHTYGQSLPAVPQ